MTKAFEGGIGNHRPGTVPTPVDFHQQGQGEGGEGLSADIVRFIGSDKRLPGRYVERATLSQRIVTFCAFYGKSIDRETATRATMHG